MLKKACIVFVLMTLVAVSTVFSQAVTIDTAISNAVKEISEVVPAGTRIAVLNISSDYENLSDYLINELIVNLVNTRVLQVVPRSTVELEMVNREFDFQMTGYVNDDSQKRLGQFLGAGTIITGSISRDSANTFRLIVNAIHLESFTFQSSFRASIQNDKQMKTLLTNRGSVYVDDYNFGERLGMGTVNIFLGMGSILNNHHLGWITTGIEIIGMPLLFTGLGMRDVPYPNASWYWEKEANEKRPQQKKGLIAAGSIVIGTGVLFGFIIPFFHHKPGSTSIAMDFPFSFEFASSNYQNPDSIRILYNVKL